MPAPTWHRTERAVMLLRGLQFLPSLRGGSTRLSPAPTRDAPLLPLLSERDSTGDPRAISPTDAPGATERRCTTSWGTRRDDARSVHASVSYKDIIYAPNGAGSSFKWTRCAACVPWGCAQQTRESCKQNSDVIIMCDGYCEDYARSMQAREQSTADTQINLLFTFLRSNKLSFCERQ